jgi:hypothetical protein
MIAVDESDVLGLGTGFQNLCSAEFQVFDDGDAVPVGEHVAMGVFYDAGGFGSGFLGPLVSAGGAFPVVGMAGLDMGGGSATVYRRTGMFCPAR